MRIHGARVSLQIAADMAWAGVGGAEEENRLQEKKERGGLL